MGLTSETGTTLVAPAATGILDPRTGWPVPDAPRSVSVRAATCLEAGMMATFGILNGADAEAYLQSQGVVHYVVR